MRAEILYRVLLGGYISRGTYNLETGMINGVDRDDFYFKEPIGVITTTFYDIEAMYYCLIRYSCNVAMMFNDTILLLDKSSYYGVDYHSQDLKVREYYGDPLTNVFNRPYSLIGKLSQRAHQFNFRMKQGGLLIDEDNKALIEGHYYTFNDHSLIPTKKFFTEIDLRPGSQGLFLNKDSVLEEINLYERRR